MTTDTAPAELVTEEMICAAARAYGLSYDAHTWARMEAALRAVAPMIAARAILQMNEGAIAAVAAEREACAKIARAWFDDWVGSGGGRNGDDLAAAIRARGETPR